MKYINKVNVFKKYMGCLIYIYKNKYIKMNIKFIFNILNVMKILR